MKKAVLIGINYTQDSGLRLNGCINDTVAMGNMLMDAYDYPKTNITMLRDDVSDGRFLPTAANIVRELQQAVAQSAGLEELWIHYSGHGTYKKDGEGEERDGKDEMIVPLDVRTNGCISDDILYNILSKTKCVTYLVFDCCHSGSICDLPWQFNYRNGRITRALENRVKIDNPNIFMISGSRDDQVSMDTFNRDSASYMGALTSGIIECLRYNRHNTSLFKLYYDLCRWMSSHGYSQVPCFSSSNSLPYYNITRSVVKRGNRSFYDPRRNRRNIGIMQKGRGRIGVGMKMKMKMHGDTP